MDTSPSRSPRQYLTLFLLSAASLAFEINLTRLFSVAQFYHFAFMIVSIALLGYGASGTFLALFPGLCRVAPSTSLAWLSLAAAASILGAYLLTNWLPFDSYSMLFDRRQVFILILHYIALSAPFFFSGMALALLLTAYPARAGSTYAVNLLGSAAGCVIALLAPTYVGGEGMVTLGSLVAVLAAACSTRVGRKMRVATIGAAILLVVSGLDLGLRLTRQAGLPGLALHISPYKGLSYALQVPGARVTSSMWNAFSRIDVVESPGIHSVPGLSYRYLQPLSTMDGLFVDGDDLNPLVQPSTDPAFTAYLPAAVAYALRPIGNTLVLEPRGGIDILTAFTQGSGWVSSVELNPLTVSISPVYEDARLSLYQESERSYLNRSPWQFDVILLSQVSSFHPVQSGAYSLSEDYRYTLEAFQEMLSHLSEEGLLVATRWIQDPPSEDLRLFALAVTALESTGADPRQQLVAFRGYNTATVLVKNGVFSPDELAKIRKFTSSRAFDLSYAPDIQAGETNRYNILPESEYYQTYLRFLESNPRQAFYDSYEYDVRPPTDDRPFFGHYFKWAQAPQIVAQFGKAWLPFGGGGYFVILALLILAVILAVTLILLPIGVGRWWHRSSPGKASSFSLRNLLYFALLGFAFLFVEIPLIQRFILYLGNPAYAFTAVLFALLLTSSLGSRLSLRLPLRLCLGLLSLLILLLPLLLPRLFDWTLGWPLAARLAVTVFALSPLGFLMGVPFPSGIRLLTAERDSQLEPERGDDFAGGVPWIWAVNGAASVVSPILAALLALSYGFNLVLQVGAVCYTAALVSVWGIFAHPRPQLTPPPLAGEK